MVGFFVLLRFWGVLKKAQSLLMLAALVLLAAFLLSFGNNLLQAASCIVGHTGKVAGRGSLPRLAEPIAPSLPDSAARQTDNSTFPVTSGGAVEASFTVVSRPGSTQAGSGPPSTANEESGFGSSPADDPGLMVEGAKVKPQPATCLGTKTLDSERDIISIDAGAMREFRGGLDRLTEGPEVPVGIEVVEERAVRESRRDVLVIE